MDYKQIVSEQRQFFNTQVTKEVSFRIRELKRLKDILKRNEELFYSAIFEDFSKSSYETYITEFTLLYSEIDLAISKVKKWSKRQSISTSWINFPSKGYQIPEPLGVSLVIGAWNYPYQLSLAPVIAALSAGCTVILKPSEIAKQAAAAMAHVINSNFDAGLFRVIEAGMEETTDLLKIKFDKIFFTGSVHVGKITYKAAAKHLTPVTLELGGKSPAIITKDVNIDMTAKRLVWAKFLNAGQTCIAPDYVLVAAEIEYSFLQAVKKHIKKADYQVKNDNYTQIINEKNFKRLTKLITQDHIYTGGSSDEGQRIIQPTVLNNLSFEHPSMQEEIFGPILPVISFKTLDNTIRSIKQLEKSLSCYIFTKNKEIKNRLLRELSFGGGAINDALMHITEDKLPFGGVGNSGFGSYHGKAGFEAFSHYKSILEKSFLLELNLKYSPYSKAKLKWLKRFIGNT